MKLHICLDFDLTLIRKHTGGVYQKLQLSDFVNADLTRQVISTCLDKGHYFSIVSHGESRELIEETIKLLGFTDENMEKIAIIAKMASDKIHHIKTAKDFHGCNGNSRTIFCDDDLTNIITAKKMGLAVILAESADKGKDEHLVAVLNILRKPYDACKICAEHAHEQSYDYLLPEYQADIRPR